MLRLRDSAASWETLHTMEAETKTNEQVPPSVALPGGAVPASAYDERYYLEGLGAPVPYARND